MTDAEFEKVRREAREYRERTSFPAASARDEYEAHSHHAEFEAARH